MAKTQKKNTQKNSKDKEKQLNIKEERNSNLYDEIWGLVLVALGIFLIFALLTKHCGALGEKISYLLSGLFGGTAIALPFFFILAGLLLLIHKVAHLNIKSFIISLILFINIDLVFSINYLNGALQFNLKEFFVSGTEAESGGVCGMSLGYALMKLVGDVGIWVVAILVISICIMLLLNTPLSRFLHISSKPIKAKVEEIKNKPEKEDQSDINISNTDNGIEVSDVEFGYYSDEFLDQYSDTSEPYDKAGAYAIQRTFGQFVKAFHGNYDNIVGFPWAEIEPYIKKALYRYRINNIDHYLKANEGKKTIKLAIDGGFTCPNRDGKKGYDGCSFCSDSGSGEFASNIDEQIELLSQKWPKAEYMAYLQNHTNTYAPLDELKAKYESILSNKMIKGLVIGTRPDCLDDDIISYLAELNTKTKLWLELGLQTVHDKTADAINRCYDTALFYERYNKLQKAGIKCVIHLILGLPGESKEIMLESIQKVAELKPFGIKLHLLNLVKSSKLAKSYPIENYLFKDIDEYTDFIVKAIRYIPPEVTIHRLTGDAPREILIHPLWSHEKRKILNQIQYKMDKDNIIQGDLLNNKDWP